MITYTVNDQDGEVLIEDADLNPETLLSRIQKLSDFILRNGTTFLNSNLAVVVEGRGSLYIREHFEGLPFCHPVTVFVGEMAVFIIMNLFSNLHQGNWGKAPDESDSNPA